MPDRYIGPVTTLLLDRRGQNYSNLYVGAKRVEIKVEMPLAEIVYDFYDKLKSVTQATAVSTMSPLITGLGTWPRWTSW